MPTLNIEGRRVRVDDAFLSMSPDEQNKAVDEIAGSLNLVPAATTTPKPEAQPDARDGTFGGVGMNATAGVNSALYGTLGAPVDLVTAGLNLGIKGINAAHDAIAGPSVTDVLRDQLGVEREPFIHPIDKPFLGSENIAGMMGTLDPRLDPKNTVATTTGERLARAAGEGAGYTIAPEAALAGLTRAGAVAPRVAETAGKVLGRSESAGAVASNAAIGGVSGAGAQAAMEASPDNYDPLAGTAGGLAFGGAATLLGGIPALVRNGTRLVGDYLAPLSETGRERLAADRFRAGVSDVDAVKDTLANPAPDLFPGSQPTTGQLTGDLGVLGQERGAAVKNPEAFAQRRADQNAARVDALGKIQPNGAPETVVSAIRNRMADIDREADDVVSRAQEAARTSATGLGEGRTPETAGGALRASLESARATAKTNERALWNAVDPSGTMVLPTTGTRKAAIDIVKSNPQAAKPIAGEEAAIIAAAGGFKDTMPLSEMTALSSRLKAEMRAERRLNGETPAYARMSKLASAIHADLDGAVLRKVQQENQAVSAGRMAMEDTAEFRLAQQRDQWISDRREGAVGDDGGTRPRSYGGTGSTSIPSVGGAASESSGRSGPAPRDPRLPSNDVGTDFDRAAQERLTAARAATAERVSTFDNPTLRPLRQGSVPDSAVPSRIFYPQAKSFDAVQSYRRAVGDEAALPALRDYAIDRLRKTALRADGTFDPTRLDAFRRSHADALRAFPELDAQIADAGRASDTLGTVVRQQEQARTELQKGALGRLIGSDDPNDVTRSIGSVFGRQDAVARMAQIRDQVRGNAEAEQGLRKAVMDHIRTQFIGNAEAGTSGVGTIKADGFQTFVKRNGAALRAAGISDYELRTLGMIADDLQRANRSIVAVKNPGGSNTAQDTYAAGTEGGAPSLLQRLMSNVPAAAGAAGGFTVGGTAGAFGGALGAKTLADMRMAGLQSVDDIITDALLNPGRARVLLAKVRTPQQEEGALKTLGQMYRRSAATAGIISVDGEDKPYEGITVDSPSGRRSAGVR